MKVAKNFRFEAQKLIRTSNIRLDSCRPNFDAGLDVASSTFFYVYFHLPKKNTEKVKISMGIRENENKSA